MSAHEYIYDKVANCFKITEKKLLLDIFYKMSP